MVGVAIPWVREAAEGTPWVREAEEGTPWGREVEERVGNRLNPSRAHTLGGAVWERAVEEERCNHLKTSQVHTQGAPWVREGAPRWREWTRASQGRTPRWAQCGLDPLDPG